MLISIPWPTNTGYAMHRAEAQFLAVAQRLVRDPRRIFFTYKNLDGGHPRSLPESFRNIVACDVARAQSQELENIERVVREHDIDVMLGYDLGVSNSWYSRLRRAGVTTMISYVGAPMSQANSGLVLLVKRIQVRCIRSRPDHFVFQSRAMQRLAVEGRGVPLDQTSVIRTGVNVNALPDRDARQGYAHQALGVPTERQLVVFSGHVNARKGIGTLIEAMEEIVHRRSRRDIQAVLLGAVDPAETELVHRVHRLKLTDHVMFAGYRDDVFDIFASASIGVIPTVGWDSFPRSGLEMQGCGLPLVVTRRDGLPELIEEGLTGFIVEPGDPIELADRFELLMDDIKLQRDMGSRAADRIKKQFSDARFLDELSTLVAEVASSEASAKQA